MIPINFFAVLVATVASIALGFLWYGPIFGKVWIKLMGFTPEYMEAAKNKPMGKTYALMALGSLFMSFVLAHALIFGSSYLHVTGFCAALQCAFWNWLGFIAPVTLGSVLWEGKSWKLWILNNGYYLVTLTIMATILAYWV